jgi:hypothetical protein
MSTNENCSSKKLRLREVSWEIVIIFEESLGILYKEGSLNSQNISFKTK